MTATAGIKVGDRVQVHNPAPGDLGVVMELDKRPAQAAQALVWWDDGSKSTALIALLRRVARPGDHGWLLAPMDTEEEMAATVQELRATLARIAGWAAPQGRHAQEPADYERVLAKIWQIAAEGL